MKKTAFLGFVMSIVLLACGTEEPPAEAVDPEATADELTPETPEAAVQADEEAVPELVEESAAEPDEAQAEDQPILLARNTDPELPAAAPREWQFSEGQHFRRLVPTQPTVGGADRIEVAEIFWYGCPHCFSFEPLINEWAENAPANARFIRIPALWNPLARLHGQLYYTEEVLAKNGKLADAAAFHSAVFNEFHRKSNRLTSEEAIQKLFERYGVSEEDFSSTWNSFEVNQKMRVAHDLVRRYGVTGVPSIVVNGKYRTAAAEAGSYTKLVELIDELIARESIR
ncbi:MAG: thiol:disulfide interchange protein DsbA/DsbL [Woeseia sp.]